ncbi:MAG: VOC family protein [Tannerellaceae bacterium]|jgi:PhnB protein|nr:VOC family protein [Tannerellaceae bacterium]
MNLKVHLVFAGTCEEALNFYNETLNGKVDFLFRKKEDKDNEVADCDKEKISHMVVKTEHFDLAGEDANNGEKVVVGNNNKLVLSFYDLDRCKKVWATFEKNGTVTMPLQKTFFCEAMGEVTDKYGISWIIMMNDDDYSA